MKSIYSFYQYLRYFHISDTIVFSIPSPIIWASFHLYVYVGWFMLTISIFKRSKLHAVQISSGINNMVKYACYVETGAGKVQLGSYDGASYTGYDGAIMVTMCQISFEWCEDFVYRSNTWQTLPGNCCEIVAIRCRCLCLFYRVSNRLMQTISRILPLK